MRPEVEQLISSPEDLLQVTYFKRGISRKAIPSLPITGDANTTHKATLPNLEYQLLSQEKLLQELHPEAHDVLVDENIPSISVKLSDGTYAAVEHRKMALPYQRTIRNKALLHLCGNGTEHTLLHTNPTERQVELFTTFKQYWRSRNQDGIRTKAVREQMSVAMSGWLYYFDYYGQIQSKTLPFEDGYVLCPHVDNNGDTLINSVYYRDKEGNETIDSYDDTNMYRFVKIVSTDGAEVKSEWVASPTIAHGFSRCPLIIHKGAVPWDDGQTIIEVYEILYNIFTVIMKRHGWGILYISGNFSEKAKRIAGSVILKDTSFDGSGKAEFKTPPNPDGMFDMLESLREEMQIATSTTFLLPKDISMSGDISGIAIQLTQSGDNEKAVNNAIEWQEAINQATLLFKEGLAKELVNSGVNTSAITDYASLNITSRFVPWMPKSMTDMASVLQMLTASGITSRETGIDIMDSYGINSPSEKLRLENQNKADDERAIALNEATSSSTTTATATTTTENNTADGDESND